MKGRLDNVGEDVALPPHAAHYEVTAGPSERRDQVIQ